MTKCTFPALAVFLAWLSLTEAPTFAQTPSAVTIEDPSTAHLPTIVLPYSNFASPEARALAGRLMREPPFDFGDNIVRAREHFGRYNDERLAEMRALYATREEHRMMGGVPVDVVMPVEGVSERNANTVLINVHGGAWMWGSGSGALVEAIPIASVGRIKVVTVDYRLAPEHRYPAASEDVASVYRELLKTYPAENIGLYGCSAGGVVVAQATAWFQTHDLPTPGAIGTFCGTGSGYGGDSLFLGPAMTGGTPPPPSAADTIGIPNPYMAGVALDDPEAYPATDKAVIAKFPPTLLLAGGRDFAASALTTMHRRLAQVGGESELFLFDGLGHAFFVWPELPESQEAYGLIASFFDRHLAHPAVSTPKSVQARTDDSTTPSATPERTPSPADLYGPLFEAVQSGKIFPDGKTFVDATPRLPVAEIMADYARVQPRDETTLRAFVEARFILPKASPTPDAPPVIEGLPLKAHISALWPVLTRAALEPVTGSSALAMPSPYIVPGGRFREIYYWDTYFTMLGLKADGEQPLVESMLENFQALIAAHGHIPNGSRTYYLSRSQPPFFALMIGLSERKDPDSRQQQLQAMRDEYAFWMSGTDCVAATGACRHVVRMPDGALLNRYWDARNTPRDESWAEDVATARKAVTRSATEVYRDLRSGAESGWDFSSRWLDDPQDLATIRTTEIVPVDLNSLLWTLERTIADHCRVLADRVCVRDFDHRAAQRKLAINRFLWSDADHRFGDWDRRTGRMTRSVSAAGIYPLFTGLASQSQADDMALLTETMLLAPGGLRTTALTTGQQWDAPNGWAPLQWIAISGLDRYGHHTQAESIAIRWLGTVDRVYRETGKMLEKYDIEQQRPGGGGEYPLQDGFGWTNGVTRVLLDQYPDALTTAPGPCPPAPAHDCHAR
ncbi:alpha,alpha-trehalase TreF [Hyphomonas oceanitis]|uniref:alpha,alpha-trehalase TreF n=1 Tax=Hyphomonas oceanitis TaxID=81033 RepID=UPI0030013E7B